MASLDMGRKSPLRTQRNPLFNEFIAMWDHVKPFRYFKQMLLGVFESGGMWLLQFRAAR